MVSCSSVAYLGQAAKGQISLLLAREPIDALLSEQGIDAELRESLTLILELREFAASELGLPVGSSYESYVQLDRDFVVWNVFVAPEFSVDALTWCYPIAGCVGYRGFFSEEAAQASARALEAQGFEVYVGGVSAYSTLGWFDDPVLSSMLARSDLQLASTLFHELAHQVAYARGDTTFNESFASVVEREAMARWLASRGESPRLTEFEQSAGRRDRFTRLVLDARAELAELYSQQPAPGSEALRSAKAELRESLRVEYAALKMTWQDFGGYDAWFAGPLNNAQLSTIATYNGLVAEFECLLRQSEGELPDFFSRVSQLAKADELASTRLLEATGEGRGCGAADGLF